MLDDYDAIRNVVQLCLDGEAAGDVEKLREAFHEDARMFGSVAGERYDVPISTLMRCRRVRRRTPAGAQLPLTLPRRQTTSSR